MTNFAIRLLQEQDRRAVLEGIIGLLASFAISDYNF